MDPFIGELRIFPYSFEPNGWHTCDGRLLSIGEYSALFAVIGTTYGGDGVTTFALPDLRGAVPVHWGDGLALGQRGGAASHALTAAETAHRHTLQASAAPATSAAPTGRVLAASAREAYGPPGGLATLADGALASAGGGQPHTNFQPSLVLRFCIAYDGLYPQRG